MLARVLPARVSPTHQFSGAMDGPVWPSGGCVPQLGSSALSDAYAVQRGSIRDGHIDGEQTHIPPGP